MNIKAYVKIDSNLKEGTSDFLKAVKIKVQVEVNKLGRIYSENDFDKAARHIHSRRLSLAGVDFILC